MTDVIEMLAAVSPDVNDEPVPPVDEVWRKLDAADGQRHARRSLPASVGGQRRAVMRWATVGVAAVAAAVAVLVVGTTGGGPTSAFAGWSATPTPPASGQLQAAQTDCEQTTARFRVSPQLAATLNAVPALSDTRGPFSLLIYTDNAEAGICIVGTGFWQASAVVMAGPSDLATTTPTVAADAIGVYMGNFDLPDEAGGAGSAGSPVSIIMGQAGADVTGVTLTLNDGSTVEATTTNGWFAAWWPGCQGAQSATVTTASGTTTQLLNTYESCPTSGQAISGGTGTTPTN